MTGSHAIQNLKWAGATTLGTLLITTAVTSCGPQSSNQLNPSTAASGVPSGETLYVASGACYGGGVTTATGSQTVVAYDAQTGSFKRVVVDYGSYSPGDQPVAIAEYDATRLLVTIENTSGRRIDLVNKDGSGVLSYITNSTALSAVLRAAKFLPDGSFLVSKSSAIEKFSSVKARVLQSGNPYVNSPGSTCATVATLISGVETLANGKILLTHSAATPNNKFVMISAAGYAGTSDCLASQAAPNTTAMPTALIMHSSGKLLVAYGSTTNASNFVYSYAVNGVANTISSPVAAFNDGGTIVYGPSAMVESPLTSDIFVANAASNLNSIERFSFDPNAGVMTRVASKIAPSIYTRCVAALKAIRE